MTGLRLTTAILSAAVTAFLPTFAQAEDQPMYAVMVEFDVATDQTDAVLTTVEGLLTDLVRHQEGFIQARLNRQADGAKVINYMLWKDADAFKAFRAGNQELVSQAIGQYGPKFSFYNIASSVEPPN